MGSDTTIKGKITPYLAECYCWGIYAEDYGNVGYECLVIAMMQEEV